MAGVQCETGVREMVVVIHWTGMVVVHRIGKVVAVVMHLNGKVVGHPMGDGKDRQHMEGEAPVLYGWEVHQLQDCLGYSYLTVQSARCSLSLVTLLLS